MSYFLADLTGQMSGAFTFCPGNHMSKESVTSLPRSSSAIPYPAGGEMGHNFNKSPEILLCPAWIRTTKPLPLVNKGPLMLGENR